MDWLRTIPSFVHSLKFTNCTATGHSFLISTAASDHDVRHDIHAGLLKYLLQACPVEAQEGVLLDNRITWLGLKIRDNLRALSPADCVGRPVPEFDIIRRVYRGRFV